LGRVKRTKSAKETLQRQKWACALSKRCLRTIKTSETIHHNSIILFFGFCAGFAMLHRARLLTKNNKTQLKYRNGSFMEFFLFR